MYNFNMNSKTLDAIAFAATGGTSFYGADFYGLPRNTDQITLINNAWTVPESISFVGDVIVPLRAGQQVAWKLL